MHKFEIKDLDVVAFVKELGNCKGQVWMTTVDGDKMNLMSSFCRIVGLMSIVQGGSLSHATIECELEEDQNRLFGLTTDNKA